MPNSLNLLLLEFGVKAKAAKGLGRILLELVYAHHHGVATLHRLLIFVCRVVDFVLDVISFDGSQRSTHGIDAVDVLARALLDLIGKLFDVMAAAKRIGGIGNTALVRDDLLGSKSQPGRLFSGQSE